MRWGSLSYIARAWQEQSTTTDICSAAEGRYAFVCYVYRSLEHL
ncbi:unnamed protein product, partial [Ectocarpus sp. 12 AP-2014]